ncbi:MAG: 4-(cytidine 5'-diphospho)-2-C-methyl-D-erythritol kinase [Sediminibacterium sp.]
MVAFPPAKINLGLYITGKRPDGYHDLSTLFLPIDLCDAIECMVAPPDSKEDVQFTATGLSVAGSLQDNLCVRAWHLLRKQDPSLPRVQMHLHKVIPMGAGLGGGSSDGSTMLLLLQGLSQNEIPMSILREAALELGSDCPFFLHPVPSLATGRGEILTPVQVALQGYKVWLVHPGLHISTAAAFARVQPQPMKVDLPTLIQQPITEWRHRISNQFEASVFSMHPELSSLKEKIYAAGALYASMSGSGSSLYGIFPPNAACPDIQFPGSTQHWVNILI